MIRWLIKQYKKVSYNPFYLVFVKLFQFYTLPNKNKSVIVNTDDSI